MRLSVPGPLTVYGTEWAGGHRHRVTEPTPGESAKSGVVSGSPPAGVAWYTGCHDELLGMTRIARPGTVVVGTVAGVADNGKSTPAAHAAQRLEPS
ncbi:MAG: hypothetical protein ACRD0P_26890 [Stackebrandtia sp.]